MPGCNRKGGSDDHFHAMASDVHLCGSEHSCEAICEATGSCKIATKLCTKMQTFKGKRSEFQYNHISEQNGIKKRCCLVIPPWKESHEGPHSHTMNPDAVHYCKVRCQGCKYFCTLPKGHSGLHTTTHGNMLDLHFVSEKEDIDILHRKYVWGESGVAELCHMYCKAQGRGHIHLLKCREQEPDGACAAKMYSEGGRHQTRQYGPNLDVAKDEFTHREFWNHMKFEDPCQPEDQLEFGLCNHRCPSEEHDEQVGPTSCEQIKSYCTELLWHVPVQPAPHHSLGYVSKDGHLFPCSHPDTAAHHILFLIDGSKSMEAQDMKPRMSSLILSTSDMHNRLGCVYEAIQRFMEIRVFAGCNDLVFFILFSRKAEVLVKYQQVNDNGGITQLLEKLLVKKPSYGTRYLPCLQSAEKLLRLCPTGVDRKPPVLIFLSDGEESGSYRSGDAEAAVARMKCAEPDLVLHTIHFGKQSTASELLLQKMAEAGGGTFNQSIDELALAKSMDMLARSLREPVAALR